MKGIYHQTHQENQYIQQVKQQHCYLQQYQCIKVLRHINQHITMSSIHIIIFILQFLLLLLLACFIQALILLFIRIFFGLLHCIQNAQLYFLNQIFSKKLGEKLRLILLIMSHLRDYQGQCNLYFGYLVFKNQMENLSKVVFQLHLVMQDILYFFHKLLRFYQWEIFSIII
ncbi:hypothetical protein IMG5_163620 [Ichthyophthirius multifiliis]|uniref:Transmembrane protein n=1 Tax=Ichthyophthirius multifiliis TaxID=5932 RepID=G0R0D5_ICHMU|nr:hypothetical protein IMG5_163620 [Ichthyophthirius multifiliis]EGR29072.1 hypothetical protein IMG5_163620 [Ichthyophthirius multifiliis]|eukprot:XP_004030308.1 hypothetical protein IMG5_163620 [Ichthyophthirius multifiliis]